MENMAKRRARVKPTRTVQLLLPTFEGNAGVIRLRVGDETADYLVQPIGSDFGDGFRLTKLDPWGDSAPYDVHLSNDGHACSCECKGFLRWSRCKHVHGLAALRLAGKL
jgi:hypothetical protein